MLPTQQTVDGLVRFETGGAKALSLYLWTDPARGSGRNLRAQLQDLERAVHAELAALGEEAPQAFDEAWARAGRLLEGSESPPRAAAIFVCPERGLEAFVRLPAHVAPRATWSDRLYLRPLLATLDEHERTLIVLLDKESARLIVDYVGEAEEVASLHDDVPGRHAQGGYSQSRFQREHDTRVEWHVGRVVDAVARLSEIAPIDRILVGGPPEARAVFDRVLPRRLRSRIGGSVAVGAGAPMAEVLSAARRVEEAVERAHEEELVEDLLERTDRCTAVVTADDVAAAVSDRRVALLVYGESARRPGARCAGCGRLFADATRSTCACGGAVAPVADTIDLLLQSVLSAGGRIEEVRGEAAERIERAAGGVVALLRYPRTVAMAPAAEAAAPDAAGRIFAYE